MKAVVFYGPHDLRLESVDVPRPQEGEILVKVVSAGVCMTDVHIFHGDFDVRAPVVLGHEFSGVVESVGPGVKVVAEGDWIGVDPTIYCGTCHHCRLGHHEQCANFRCLGNTEHGCYADYALIKEFMAYPLRGLQLDEAAFLEPLSCILFALERHPIVPGQSVLIVGGGPVGNLFAQTASAFGAVNVAVVDPNRTKLDLALRVGIPNVYEASRSGEDQVDQQISKLEPFGFDYVVDTTGRPTALNRALGWTGRRGTVLLFGVSSKDASLSVSPADIFAREITIFGSAGSVNTFAQAIKLLSAGVIQTEPLIWRRVGLDEVPDVIEILSRPGDKGKVMVHP